VCASASRDAEPWSGIIFANRTSVDALPLGLLLEGIELPGMDWCCQVMANSDEGVEVRGIANVAPWMNLDHSIYADHASFVVTA
jgi:hypothetical protein